MELHHVLYLLLAFLIGRFWWLTGQAREHAENLAKKICTKESLQLLDGSVALTKLEIKRASSLDFRLIRHFKFEFSVSGDERRHGVIALHKLKQEYVYLDLPETPIIDIENNGEN